MPKAPLLPDEDIARGVATLRAWRREGDALVKSFTFAGFAEAVAFVAGLVEPSDERDHHPDVLIHWNEVTLRLWTHASGGITARDLDLARAIDGLTEG